MEAKTISKNQKPKILVVDDRPENLMAMEALLDGLDVNVVKATSGNEALSLALKHEFALGFLDVQMPGMGGFETAELMRSIEECRHLPIIFVTAISKERQHIFQGYETGAVDYLFKPVDSIVLRSKARVFLELDRRRMQLKEANKQLAKLAVRDELTGIFNRRHLLEHLKREFALSKRHSNDLCCVMFDLDHFKEVNDTFGHDYGDFVLRSFSALIKKETRTTDIWARYGGEEFVLLVPATNLEGAQCIAEKLRAKAEKYIYKKSSRSRKVTVSIGVASLKDHNPGKAGELVAFADAALYQAKAEGRNRVCVYQNGVDEG